MLDGATVKPSPNGRPAHVVTAPTQVCAVFSPELLRRLDALAEAAGVRRAEMLRRLVAAAS